MSCLCKFRFRVLKKGPELQYILPLTNNEVKYSNFNLYYLVDIRAPPAVLCGHAANQFLKYLTNSIMQHSLHPIRAPLEGHKAKMAESVASQSIWWGFSSWRVEEIRAWMWLSRERGLQGGVGGVEWDTCLVWKCRPMAARGGGAPVDPSGQWRV